jgi:hypothetical protein
MAPRINDGHSCGMARGGRIGHKNPEFIDVGGPTLSSPLTTARFCTLKLQTSWSMAVMLTE